MKIGAKYKIARKLRSKIFEKTQTQKYAVREEKKLKNKPWRPKTDFGNQLNEKQKARMFYIVSEKQFRNYVTKALSDKTGSPAANLLSLLEKRLDNVVWRSGILPTHLSARQAVAHGHFLVNGRKVYTPSYHLREGDKISIREGSKGSKLFSEVESKLATLQFPAWLSVNAKDKEITVKSESVTVDGELFFDLGQVIEYYQR